MAQNGRRADALSGRPAAQWPCVRAVSGLPCRTFSQVEAVRAGLTQGHWPQGVRAADERPPASPLPGAERHQARYVLVVIWSKAANSACGSLVKVDNPSAPGKMRSRSAALRPMKVAYSPCSSTQLLLIGGGVSPLVTSDTMGAPNAPMSASAAVTSPSLSTVKVFDLGPMSARLAGCWQDWLIGHRGGRRRSPVGGLPLQLGHHAGNMRRSPRIDPMQRATKPNAVGQR